VPLPSLDHAITVTDLTGRSYRWSQEERDKWDIPSSVQWSTRRADGYAEASFQLQRPITRDFPDLGLLNEITVTAADGTTVYQGRVTSFPRSSNPATGEFFNVTATGWMSHATDRTFQEIYVDRDLSAWSDSSVQRNITSLAANFRLAGPSVAPDDTTGQPALLTQIDGAWIAPYKPRVEPIYDAQGIALGSIYYAWKRVDPTGTAAPWAWRVFLSTTDTFASFDGSANLVAAGPGTGTLSATSSDKVFAALQYQYEATPAGSDGFQYPLWWTVLAAYGNHGLTKQGTASATAAQGFYASDVIENIVARFCPLLDASTTVDATSYVLGQLAFKEPTKPYDAITQINQYHQYEVAVWEDRKFYFTQPTALDDWDWEIRLEDPETTANLQGDSIDDLANGIVVRYTDLIDGSSKTLTPETNTELADTSETNPANLAGIDRWTEYSISDPTLAADALQIGRAALGEASRPKAPGEFTIGPYIRDRHGNWQPGSRVRAGQRVVVSDHPNDAPRRIQDTTWNDQEKSLRITTDNVSQRLEGFIARRSLGRSTAGLG